MGTTSNSLVLVSDCCVTDALAEIGLNIREQTTDTTIDIDQDHINNFDLFCFPDKRYTDEQESGNGRNHVLEITENCAEYIQPIEKLRLFSVIPNEGNNVCDKAEMQAAWRPPHCVPSWKRGTSFISGNQDAGLPCSINSTKQLIKKYFGIGNIATQVPLYLLTEELRGKQAICMTRIRALALRVLQNNDFDNKDWVIAGVIVKEDIITSEAGEVYCSWTLSDLGERLLTMTVLLVRSVFNPQWTMSLGSVVGILNPFVMETRSQHDGEATFTVGRADQVMHWGYSKAFGICEEKKRNGEKCGMFFNRRMYDCCAKHLVKTYEKFSGVPKGTGRILRQPLSKKMGWSTPVGNKTIRLEEKVPVRRNRNVSSTSSSSVLKKIDIKDKIEDKLPKIYKMRFKIVMCTDCKYMTFGSPLTYCKQKNHLLIQKKGYKRSFGCLDCGKRIICDVSYPHQSCIHCGSSSWKRVPIIEEEIARADLN